MVARSALGRLAGRSEYRERKEKLDVTFGVDDEAAAGAVELEVAFPLCGEPNTTKLRADDCDCGGCGCGARGLDVAITGRDAADPDGADGGGTAANDGGSGGGAA